MSGVTYVTINSQDIHRRLDNYLISQLKGLPKSLIYKMIRKGSVRINRRRATADSKLNLGDSIRIPPVQTANIHHPTPSLTFLKKIESAIIFEDESLLVLNKPCEIAVHGGSGINLGVIETLRTIRPNNDFLDLVHRLDKPTSGCLLIAKKRSMLRHIHQQIRMGRMQKQYQALVINHWPQKLKIINEPLQKNILSSGERIVSITKNGKPSKTCFQVLNYFQVASLLKITPKTGRTHQIRVHTKSKGHPIIGDTKYGNQDINNKMKAQGIYSMMLHAWKVKITLPNEKDLEIVAPVPINFSQAINILQNEKNYN